LGRFTAPKLSFQGPKTDVFMRMQAHKITSLQIQYLQEKIHFLTVEEILYQLCSYLVCEQ